MNTDRALDSWQVAVMLNCSMESVWRLIAHGYVEGIIIWPGVFRIREQSAMALVGQGIR